MNGIAVSYTPDSVVMEAGILINHMCDIIEEMIREERQEFARTMLIHGEPLEKIICYTHLSEDEIEEVRKDMMMNS